MKKDPIRDYAEAAFIKYAKAGYPTLEKAKEQIVERVKQDNAFSNSPEDVIEATEKALLKKKAYLDDIEAVNVTLKILERDKKPHILKAVRAVYFNLPKDRDITVRDISNRVKHFATIQYNIDISLAYRWLKYARAVFAGARGLDF